jgi:hypothetical protein
MDRPWCRTWRSTVANVNSELLEEYAKHFNYLQPPARDGLRSLELRLRKLRSGLKAGDTSCWRKRSKILLTLRFPELATGDAWRALQLAERSERESVTLLLGQALFLANAFLECIDVVDSVTATAAYVNQLSTLRTFAKAAYAKEQADSIDRDSDEEGDEQAIDGDRFGEVDTRAYPWIPSSQLRRDTDLLQSLNSELKRVSQGQCEVKESEIVNVGSDCFGIFARGSIAAGSTLFIDSTAISATCDTVQRCDACGGEFPRAGQVKWSCCSSPERFCSLDCKVRAKSTYHGVLCGRAVPELDLLDEMMGPNNLDTQDEASWKLWTRVLALIKRSLDRKPYSFEHPLDVPAVKKLTTRYGVVRRFSLLRDIICPVKILEQLGVDVYKDLRYDTWVLWTISLRMEANLAEHAFDAAGNEEGILLSISTHHTFFNHSCRPNVGVLRKDKSGSAMVIYAKRAIRAGEELFISYIGDDDLALNVHEREEMLRPWTGGRCSCAKCTRELNQSIDDGDDEYDPDSTSGDENESSVSM